MIQKSVFEDKVRREVREIRDDFPGLANEGDAFSVWATSFLHDEDVDTAIEMCDVSAGGSDGGIDAIAIDNANSTVFLMQTKYSSDSKKVFSSVPLEELVSGLTRLLSPVYSESMGSKFAEHGKAVRDALAGGASIVLEVVIFGSASSDLIQSSDSIAEALNLDIQVSAKIYTFGELEEISENRLTTNDLSGQEVQFLLAAELQTVKTRAYGGHVGYYLAVLDAHNLAAIAAEHRSSLVDWNIRYRLSSSKINQAISNTLASPEGRSNFLILNNGLTVVCQNLEEDGANLTLTNPQIVNGAQTAMTLADNVDNVEQGEAQLLARIVVVESDGSGEQIAREVAESTNRQNPVSAADLKAQDKLQRRIEADFEHLDPPYFYERRRNSYTGLSRAEQKRYAGKITKEDAGQRFRAMLGEPAVSITEKSKMFEDFRIYGRVYNEEVDVSMYALSFYLYKLFYDMLHKSNPACREAVYPDMDESEREMLVRARAQWSAHGSALCYWLLSRHYGNVSRQRALEIAGEIRDGITDKSPYISILRFSALVIVKWANGKRTYAISQEEAFDIKHDFQNLKAFDELTNEAKSMLVFMRANIFDVLPI